MSDTRESLLSTLASAGQSEKDLGTVGQTILRPQRVSTLPALPKISLGLRGVPGGEADFVPGTELGRGGMGVVQLARQESLGREVAIKTARSTDDGVKHALVREARIMGSLEHPNVVPVHVLGVDAEGAPILVMKRIEGTSWRELLAQPGHPGWAPLLLGHNDRLRANVEILTQVCRALAFAHDRGVVHRDLKPENVMIGRFGEVYLLDWGIAMRLSERGAEPKGIVGTPGYIAPEMARGDPTQLDARCDVYLLGAVLYEILSGRVPHDAPDVTASLISSVSGTVPPLPADAPDDLAQLVTHALATRPEQRLESVERFREGLAKFLISRQAEVLATDARAAFARAKQVVAAEGAASASFYRALVEARFGFTSAQRMRPGDERLRREHEQVLLELVERELAVRSPSAARALLSELSAVPAGLADRVARLEREVELERSAAGQLQQSRRDADSSESVRPLLVMAVPITIVGVLAGLWFLAEPGRMGDRTTSRAGVFADVGMMSLMAVGTFIFRRRLFKTPASSRISLGGMLWAGGVPFADLIGVLTRCSVDQIVSLSMGAGLVGAVTVTALVLRDVWPAILVQLIALGAALTAQPGAQALAAGSAIVNVALFARAVYREGKRSRAN